MKMRLLSTVGLSALVLSGILLTLHSCNKNPQSTSQQQGKDDDLLKADIAKKGHSFTVPVNQKIEAVYVDAAGERISAETLRQRSAGAHSRTASIISACDYSNTPVSNLNTYGISVNCAQNFTITWDYTVSTNNNLVPVNSTVPTAISKGSVRVTNSSGSTIYSETNSTATIVDLGADVNNPGYENYDVTFTSNPIDISNFSSSNSIRLGGLVVTDCPDVEPISISLQGFALNGSNSAVTNPCYRVDAIYPAQVTAPFRIWGEDPAGFCIPYVYPSMQEVQYSIDGGTTWVGETATPTLRYWATPGQNTPFDNYINAHLGYVDPVGALELQIDLPHGNTYNILLRNRNIVFNGTLASYGNKWPVPVFGTGGNCCAGPWSTVSFYRNITY